MFLILNPTPNVATAYSCSSGSSTIKDNSASSGVSGTSGSCATSTSSSSNTKQIGGGSFIGAPNHSGGSSGLPNPGASISVSDGGGQSSCAAESASHANVGHT